MHLCCAVCVCECGRGFPGSCCQQRVQHQITVLLLLPTDLIRNRTLRFSGHNHEWSRKVCSKALWLRPPGPPPPPCSCSYQWLFGFIQLIVVRIRLCCEVGGMSDGSGLVYQQEPIVRLSSTPTNTGILNLLQPETDTCEALSPKITRGPDRTVRQAQTVLKRFTPNKDGMKNMTRIRPDEARRKQPQHWFD